MPEQTEPTSTEQTTPERRTKRRFAHELYPQGPEYETRPLTVEVPHLYARALGFEVRGTSWFDFGTPEEKERALARTHQLIDARHIAFLADALAQDLVGDEAWRWADEHVSEESGELVWERAVAHGVDPERIKPYPCGPEPENHWHADPARPGTGFIVRAAVPESKCEQCTEPVGSAS